MVLSRLATPKNALAQPLIDFEKGPSPLPKATKLAKPSRSSRQLRNKSVRNKSDQERPVRRSLWASGERGASPQRVETDQITQENPDQMP